MQTPDRTIPPSALLLGLAGLLLLDRQFVKWSLAPTWWLPLRLGLTAVVILTLLPGANA